jgi:hypothetical protein
LMACSSIWGRRRNEFMFFIVIDEYGYRFSAPPFSKEGPGGGFYTEVATYYSSVLSYNVSCNETDDEKDRSAKASGRNPAKMAISEIQHVPQ